MISNKQRAVDELEIRQLAFLPAGAQLIKNQGEGNLISSSLSARHPACDKMVRMSAALWAAHVDEWLLQASCVTVSRHLQIHWGGDAHTKHCFNIKSRRCHSLDLLLSEGVRRSFTYSNFVTSMQSQ